MSCFHPLQLTQWVNKITGELISKITPSYEQVESVDDPLIGNQVARYLIPCGQCSGCRSDRAHGWADRLLMESLYQGESRTWCVTLTYDDEHLPGKDRLVLDRDTLQPLYSGCLNMDDVSAWIKRLRAALDQPGIRYYAAGEYGDHTRRPHYHVILFADIPDARSCKLSDSGEHIVLPRGRFWSPIVEKTWGKGLTDCSPAGAAAMSYVAGYVTKKLFGKHEEQYQDAVKILSDAVPEITEQPRECARMSRRPGLGVPWLLQNADKCVTGRVALPTPDGSRSAPLPRIAASHLDRDIIKNIKNQNLIRSAAYRDRQRQILDGRRTLDDELKRQEKTKLSDPRRTIRKQSL